MKSKVEKELSECKAGYRTNRGTTDMPFVLLNIIEKVNYTYFKTCITFIDYNRAFDSVIHNTLFETMCVLGFPKHLFYPPCILTSKLRSDGLIKYRVIQILKTVCDKDVSSLHIYSDCTLSKS